MPHEGLGGLQPQETTTLLPLPAKIYMPWTWPWPELVLLSRVGLCGERRREGSQTMKVQTRLPVSPRPEQLSLQGCRETWKRARRARERQRQRMSKGQALTFTGTSTRMFWICAFIWKLLAPPAQIKFWLRKPNWRPDLALPSCFPPLRGLPGLWNLISWISRDPRRREARPSLRPSWAILPPTPGSSREQLQEQSCDLVVWGWKELEKPEKEPGRCFGLPDRTQQLGGPSVCGWEKEEGGKGKRPEGV